MSFYIADEMRSIESSIINSYPTSVSGIIVLLNTKHLTFYVVLNVNPCKHHDCILLLLTVSKAEFRGQFPYLDKLQDIGFIPSVESQSDSVQEI